MRGDVFVLKAASTKGHEQRGPRFAVVVQSSRLEHLSTWLVVPTSTRAQRYIFRPAVTIPHHGETVAVCDAMTAVDPQARLGEYVGYLPLDQMQQIDRAVLALLDLD
ncbi:type II toxin-antitoxin system PemK/MazF family toxin [Pengzhenrongella frigida]|uniref:Type II toxin-antitoxin system PemK/MazF family toxin n=1 Tax=Pengzhenrongella frigida TaxID=1259133 RepID=A0A4Q5MXF1_9MICO|nr:type II toxin-antitoxin system PemK/MazF family toxin [Cellulomonas sp. HLT2-17]RYV50422.1 type II toxin-antitoxin system PemK/MazF family toxin [Cellulomonas sp. HLT2-17]